MHNTASQIDQISNLIVDDAAAQSKPEIKLPEKVEVSEETTDEVVETTDEAKPVEGEVEAVEAADESQQEGEKSSEEVAEGDEVATDSDVDTLNSLAEKLDIEVSDFYALDVKLSKGEPKSLGALKDFYEQNMDIESLREGITQKEQALTQQSEEVAKIPEITNDLLQAKANEMAIRQQYDRVDWAALRQSDPGQYAALQSDFQTQYAQAQASVSDISGQVDTHTANQAKFQQDKLFEAIPELKDDAFRKQASNSVNNLVSKYGFSAEEMGNITDSRLMHLLIDAAKGNDAVESVKAKKVEKPAAVSSKPASTKTPRKDASRQAALKRLTEKAKTTGDRRDVADAVSMLIG